MNHPDKWKAGEAYIEFQTLKNRIHYINILSFNGGSDFNIHTENQGLSTPWILNPSAPGSLNNSLIIIKFRSQPDFKARFPARFRMGTAGRHRVN